jgi:hypothetical protein
MKTTNETTMTNLSPAAQAVIDAYWATPDEPITTQIHQAAVAAALRAAVDQVMSNEWPTIEDYNEYDQGFNFARITYRNELLDIAAELEGKQ